jgi:SAM-dependent methyltransferase
MHNQGFTIFTGSKNEMGITEFFELFIKELEQNKELHGYYKLLDKPGRFLWRKAYLEQRLKYVHDHLGKPGKHIWDAGCGYGTTAIFAALNGHHVTGSTLEFYFDQINRRLDYWSRFGNLSTLNIGYENIFDKPVKASSMDIVIVQDTLHHLEPIDEACAVFNEALKKGGRLVVSEENGRNPFIQFKNIKTRGFKRVGEMYDEKLGRKILFGNENARSLQSWDRILKKAGFAIVEPEIRFVRFYPPFSFSNEKYTHILEEENAMGSKSNLLTNLFFFGVNFTAVK